MYVSFNYKKMKTKPLLNYKTPNYPQIEVVFTEPDILIKNMPESWQANKLIVSAMLSFSLAACKGQSSDIGNTVKTEQVSIMNKSDVTVNGKIDTSKIAPIFVHGEGVGASGCVMIAPPVYLSEADAMNIIFEELNKEGLTFKDKYNGDSLSVEQKKVVFSKDTSITNYRDRISYKTVKKNLYPDAFNKKLNLIIQFVSFSDYEKYADEEPEWSSVSTYEIKKAAEKIRKAYLVEAKHGVVVFYDPVGWADNKNSDNWNEMQKSGREIAIKMLKLQVSDFIEWLKKEYKIEKN
jgi:hypothetical protein